MQKTGETNSVLKKLTQQGFEKMHGENYTSHDQVSFQHCEIFLGAISGSANEFGW